MRKLGLGECVGTVFGGLLLLAGLLAPSAASAQYSIESRPRITVSSRAVVRGPVVRLGDVAKITAHEKEFQKLVDDLKALKLADSPPPMTKAAIPGGKILDAIESLGITRDSIGYSIPQLVEIEREGRVLRPEEILTDVRETLSRDPAFDLQVREISWEHAQIVPSGESRILVERLGAPSAGKVPLRIIASVDNVPAARFLATAVVDDWREVPVLNRMVERGMLITPGDISLVRLNLFKQPPDVAERVDDVIGHAAKSRMPAGEPIRKTLVDIPPLVEQGKRVTMIYQQGGLRATASGLAIDPGLRGEVIRVRNEASKRVVRAMITAADEVEIKQ